MTEQAKRKRAPSSVATIAKTRVAKKGVPMSAATKAKLSAAKRGMPWTAARRAVAPKVVSKTMSDELHDFTQSFVRRMNRAKTLKQKKLIQQTFKAALANLSAMQVKEIGRHLKSHALLAKREEHVAQRDKQLTSPDW